MRLPKIMLGTSPFISAGQFGERSRIYFERFYNNPQRIVEIIDKCHQIGIDAIQLLPEKYIIDAVELWESKTGKKLNIVSSIYDARQIEMLLGKFNHSAVLLHGAIADRHRKSEVVGFIERIRDRGVLSGIVSHTPYRTLSWALKEGIELDVVMIPINKTGYMMDSDIQNIREIVENIGSRVIAKKVLAAGRIRPREAVEYISKLDFVDSIAIGVASVEEAEETFKIAIQTFNKK